MRDKSEFRDEIASACKPKFEPRQGRKRIARGGTAKPWNPGYRKKRKLSPERRSEATQRRPTDKGEDRSEAELRAMMDA